MKRAYAALGAPGPVEVTVAGKRLKRGARVWPAGGGLLEGKPYRWLGLARPANEELAAGAFYPPGYCHLPPHKAEHLKQPCAEQRVTRLVRGYPRREWVKLRERNEALDRRVYARTAAALGLERWTPARWREAARQRGVAEVGATPDEPGAARPAPAAHPAPPAPAGSGWLERCRDSWLRLRRSGVVRRGYRLD